MCSPCTVGLPACLLVLMQADKDRFALTVLKYTHQRDQGKRKGHFKLTGKAKDFQVSHILSQLLLQG